MNNKLISELDALIVFLESNNVNADSVIELKENIKNKPSLDVLNKSNELGQRVNNTSTRAEFTEAAQDYIRFYEQHSEELASREDFYLALKRDLEVNEEIEERVNRTIQLLEDEGYY